jgi:hypothetical protein
MRIALFGVVASALMGSIAGSAQAQVIASGDEVKAVFASKTAHITHRNGNTQKAYFEADGTARITEGGKVRAGKWTIDKNTICHDLSSERKCYTVNKKEPDTYQLQSTDMKWLPTYKMVAGNPDKL